MGGLKSEGDKTNEEFRQMPLTIPRSGDSEQTRQSFFSEATSVTLAELIVRRLRGPFPAVEMAGNGPRRRRTMSSANVTEVASEKKDCRVCSESPDLGIVSGIWRNSSFVLSPSDFNPPIAARPQENRHA